MRDAFSAGQRGASAIQRCSRFRRELIVFHLNGIKCVREWSGHPLKQMNYRGKLTFVELVEQLVCLLSLVGGRHQAKFTKAQVMTQLREFEYVCASEGLCDHESGFGDLTHDTLRSFCGIRRF